MIHFGKKDSLKTTYYFFTLTLFLISEYVNMPSQEYVYFCTTLWLLYRAYKRQDPGIQDPGHFLGKFHIFLVETIFFLNFERILTFTYISSKKMKDIYFTAHRAINKQIGNVKHLIQNQNHHCQNDGCSHMIRTLNQLG